jgi:hypothetical protein
MNNTIIKAVKLFKMTHKGKLTKREVLLLQLIREQYRIDKLKQ